jgi:hypothetical protein
MTGVGSRFHFQVHTGKTRYWQLVAGTAVALAISFSTFAAPRPMRVYMMRGQGAISILGDEQYRKALGSIFQGHELTIDQTSGKAAFIEKVFTSDIVYLSLHANPEVIKIASGEKIDVPDLVLAYSRTYHQKGPALIIVTGCETLRDVESHPMNLPGAFGIRDAAPSRAYIGFKKPVEGVSSDRFFRVFLATWMRSPYPTLEEARTQAKATVQKMVSLQTGQTTQLVTFKSNDVDIANQMTIVGNANLRLSDIP